MRGRLAIDFGAAATKAATSDGAEITMMPFGRAGEFPTLVYLSDRFLKGRSTEATVGEQARRWSARAPNRLIRRLKHRVGAPGPVPPLQRSVIVDGQEVPLVDLVAQVLAVPVERATGGPTSPTILTHPVAWGEPELALLTAALRAAGRRATPMFLSEPLAAARFALEHELVSLDDGALAVFDLGASTFDTAVIGSGRAGPRTLSARGMAIGGDDFDAALLDRVSELYGEIDDELALTFETLRDTDPRPADEARRAKEALSGGDDVTFAFDDRFPDLGLTCDDLDDVVEPLLDSCLDIFSECLSTAPPGTEVANVILTGGSSQLPLVRDLVVEAAGRLHPGVDVQLVTATDVGPGQAVAPGAMAHRNAVAPKIRQISVGPWRDAGGAAIAPIGRTKLAVERGNRRWLVMDLLDGSEEAGSGGPAGGELSILKTIASDPQRERVITGTDTGWIEIWHPDGRVIATHKPHGTFLGFMRGNNVTAAAVLGSSYVASFAEKTGRYLCGDRSGSFPDGAVAVGLVRNPEAAVVVRGTEVLLRSAGGDHAASLDGDDIPIAKHAAIDPRSGLIAIVDDERGLWLFQARAGGLHRRLHRKLDGNAGAVAIVASTDGRLVAVGIDDRLELRGLDGKVRAKRTLDRGIDQLLANAADDRLIVRNTHSAAMIDLDWG